MRNTLDSFRFHGYSDDVEVIIVDDGSKKEAIKIDSGAYNFSLRVIRLDPRNKWYNNSCVPYNIGFSQCSGDLIIIQNAECLHYSNIVDYVRNNLNEINYLSFGCYSINSETLQKISTFTSFADRIGQFRIENKTATFDGEEGWYNHSKYQPVAYHFCAALTKKNLGKLGGFDDAYARGIGFDDNELIFRIKQSRMRIIIVDDFIVIHQYHYGNRRMSFGRNRLINRNRILYSIYTKNGGTCFSYFLSMLIYYAFGWHRKCAAFLKYIVRFMNACQRLKKNSALLLGRISSLMLRTFIEPFFIPLPAVRKVPVIINNRNRMTYLRSLVNWLKDVGMENIYVLDNGSNYPPLLDYYVELQNSGVEVIKLGRNAGPYSIWNLGVYKRFWRSYYIYTDSDVLPGEGVGFNGIEFLLSALREHKSLAKIGFGIHIDDLPDCFDQKEVMIKIESKYRKSKLDDRIYHAAVDTTFALYAPFHKGGPELNAGRTDHPYLVRHLPWYIDSKHKSDEEKYFEAHASTYSSMYAHNIRIG